MKQASFRGVPFVIDNTEEDFGRSVVKHQFPAREKPFAEDLGKRLSVFVIDGFVIGADHLVQKDNLIAAAHVPGVGILEHPYYGTVRVICDGIKVRNSAKEKRVTNFQFTFTEVGEQIFPSPVLNTTDNVLVQSQAAMQTFKEDFGPKWTFTKESYGAVLSAIDLMDQATSKIFDAKLQYARETKFISLLDTLKRKITSVTSDATELADDFLELITFGIIDLDENEDGIPDFRDAFKNLIKLFSFGPKISATSPGSVAMQNLIIQSSVSAAAILSANIAYGSINEANVFRDILINKIDEIMLGVTEEPVLSALSILRLSVVQDVSERSNRLPRVSKVRLPVSRPAIAISNDLYGNVDREGDIITRNKVFHPGFVPGTEIEVLTDV